MLKKVFLFIWQLPQNIFGYILTRFYKKIEIKTMNDDKDTPIYYTSNVVGCGVSLGKYIILDYNNYYGKNLPKVYNHEHGHQKQSLILGWLYLPVVGFTSAICNNLWDRVFHKNWDYEKRNKWYYSRFPENWADKLGGVTRSYI